MLLHYQFEQRHSEPTFVFNLLQESFMHFGARLHVVPGLCGLGTFSERFSLRASNPIRSHIVHESQRESHLADALTYYVSLRPERSYHEVVPPQAAHEKARSETEAAYDRHMKALRTVFAKGVAALNSMAIDSPADAMRAIQLAIREERIELGEPSDRTAISLEDTIKREYKRWMVVEDEDEPQGGASEPGA